MSAPAICFEPFENESASSLLVRAASRLSPIPGIVIRHFLGDAEAVASAVHRHEAIGIMADGLGLEPAVIERAMVRRLEEHLALGPFVVRIEDVDQTRRRVCPAVLRNDVRHGRAPYQRLNWPIRVLRFDPDTGEPIVDRCGCGNDLLWCRTVRIDECPACGSLLWESAMAEGTPEDTEAVHFLNRLFSGNAARRREVRASLPQALAGWSEGDLLELFETVGLLSEPEVLMRMPRADIEVWLRAVGIHAALGGTGSIRELVARAFDDPPADADRFWPTRRMAFANAAINRCRSPQARDFLSAQMRTFV
jgi:hypothetical protein